MRYMSKEDLDHRRHHRHHSNDMLRRRSVAPASMRQLDFNSIDQGSIYAPQQLPPPRQMLSSSPALVPACFEMNARDTTSDPPRSLHCFTRFHKRAEQPPLYLSDMQSPPSSIPKQLQDMLDDKESLINCDIILAESSIELMAMHAPGDNTELGIQIEFNSTYEHALYDHFESHTRFYTDDELATEPKSVLGYDTHYKRLHAINGTFGSGFWAVKLGELSQMMRKAYKKKGDLVPARGAVQVDDERLQQAREHANQTLKALSAIQEIFAVPRGSIITAATGGYTADPPAAERVLIVGWTFRHADAGEPGNTTWRRVVLPHQQSPTEKQEPQNAFMSSANSATNPLKQEPPNPYGQLTLDTLPGSGLITPATSTHPSFDASSHNGGFDLSDPLSSIGGPFSTGSVALPLSAASSSSAPSLHNHQHHQHHQHHHHAHLLHQPVPSSSAVDHLSALSHDHNALDFSAGQINVWMEPPVSMQGYYDLSSGPGGANSTGPGGPRMPSPLVDPHHHALSHHHHHPPSQQQQQQQPHTPVGYGGSGGGAGGDGLQVYNPREAWGGYGGLLEAEWSQPGSAGGGGNGSGGGGGGAGYGDGGGGGGGYKDEGQGGGFQRRDSGMLGL